MPITKEMSEIIEHLSTRSDYAITAGFAAHAYYGSPCSNDIDIFTQSMNNENI